MIIKFIEYIECISTKSTDGIYKYGNITDVTNLKYQEKLGAKKKTFYTNRRDYAIFISLALLSSKYN